jgi:uncharacterized protein (DUF427 family)
MSRPVPVAPAPGQESAWDYPRPPRVEPGAERIRVLVGGIVVADSQRALCVLETSHPPSYYVPPEDVRADLLEASSRTSFCEFKGRAAYRTLILPSGRRVPEVAWLHPEPAPGYEAIAGYLSFYAGRVDEAWVADERVVPQVGDFYGGWITSGVVGAFKGEPGTVAWQRRPGAEQPSGRHRRPGAPRRAVSPPASAPPGC